MTPHQIKATFAQAQKLMKAGNLDGADRLFTSLLMPTGGAPEIHAHRARIAELRGDTTAQAKALDQALAKRPNEPALLEAAIRAHGRLNDTNRVLSLYDSWIAATPKAIKPRADKAQYLQNIGNFDDADAVLRALLAQSPQEVELYRMLGAGTKLSPKDPLLKKMRQFWRDPRLNDQGRMHLGFALAKASSDLDDDPAVFEYLRVANAAQGRLAPHDPSAREAEWRAYKTAQQAFDSAPTAPTPDVTPVFVTGLPRSGTTLVEQILGAHPLVTAGGEMGHALREAARHLGPIEKMTPVSDLSITALSSLQAGYLRLIRRDTGVTTGYVTDKSIQSQLIFGLITRALPNARLIVVMRDPRDIALSIYRNHFRLGTHRYACDLAHIATVIKEFRMQIAYWRDLMPDRLHIVRYEDLVTEPEAQSRALVAAAGLDWHPDCLTFHIQKARVKTLSLAQVRQPIHAGRRAAWRRYETDMAPFIDAWGDTPWD